MESLLENIFQALRPGGIVYISDYWLQTDDRNRMRYIAFAEKYGIFGVFELPDGAVFRHHDRDYFLSLLADFKTVNMVDIDVTTMNGHKSRGFQYFGRKEKRRY